MSLCNSLQHIKCPFLWTFKSTFNNLTIINKYIKDINEIYSISDIYIFPLLNDNESIDIPLSILEARYMNLPIIISNIGHIKESIKDYSKEYSFNISKNLNRMVKEINKIIYNLKDDK